MHMEWEISKFKVNRCQGGNFRGKFWKQYSRVADETNRQMRYNYSVMTITKWMEHIPQASIKALLR